MQDQLISHEVAKLVRDLLIVNTSEFYYDGIGVLCNGNYNKYGSHPSFSPCITQSLLQKILRDKHKLHVRSNWEVPFDTDDIIVYTYSICIPPLNISDYNPEYPTYEEALEAGLLEALEILSGKKTVSSDLV